MLLETHVLEWPAGLGAEGGYGRRVRVDLLHRLHEERKYGSLDLLQRAIAQDTDEARAWLGAHPAQPAQPALQA